MNEDTAFKRLVTALPGETLSALAPDLVAAWGRPVTADPELSEVLPQVPGVERSRFLDVAIRFGWADGSERIVLLVEHWSRGRDVDLARVLLYTAELLRRDATTPVLPVMVVSDGSSPDTVRSRLEQAVNGELILDFRVRIFWVRSEVLPAWRAQPNPIYAVLAALLRDRESVAVALRAARLLLGSGRLPVPVLEVLLLLIEFFAKLDGDQRNRFHQQLREDPDMPTIVDLIRAEGEARGRAEGEARGRAEAVVSLAESGDLPVATARERLEALLAGGQLSEEWAADFRARLDPLA